MNTKIIFYGFFLVLFTCGNFCYSQNSTTISKNCGKCGKPVSVKSEVGSSCPHCGVIWGSENTQTTTSTYSFPSSSSDHLTKIPNRPPSHIGSASRKNDVEEETKSTASKTETEAWILEKLGINTPKSYYKINDYSDLMKGFTVSYYNMNYQYSFDRYNLIVKYEEKKDAKVTRYKIVVPIYAIERVYFYKGLVISTNNDFIVVYDETNNTKRIASIFSTDFDVLSEADLVKRLNKAFLHLKNFYNKPISTEPF